MCFFAYKCSVVLNCDKWRDVQTYIYKYKGGYKNEVEKMFNTRGCRIQEGANALRIEGRQSRNRSSYFATI